MKDINMKNVVWGATLPNGKKIAGGNLDILNDICPDCQGLGVYKNKKQCRSCKGKGELTFTKVLKLPPNY